MSEDWVGVVGGIILFCIVCAIFPVVGWITGLAIIVAIILLVGRNHGAFDPNVKREREHEQYQAEKDVFEAEAKRDIAEAHLVDVRAYVRDLEK